MLEHLILRDQYSFKINLQKRYNWHPWLRETKNINRHIYKKKKKLNIYRTISLIHHHYDIHLYKNLVKKQELMRSLQNPQNTEKPKLSQGLHKGAIALSLPSETIIEHSIRFSILNIPVSFALERKGGLYFHGSTNTIMRVPVAV